LVFVGVALWGGHYAYDAAQGSTHQLMTHATRINVTADPRIDAAIKLMEQYAAAKNKPNVRAASDEMYRLMTMEPPYVKGNPKFQGWAEGRVFYKAATDQIPLRGTLIRQSVISTHPNLNAADIAIQLFGEHQRRLGNWTDDPLLLNQDVIEFNDWLKNVKKSPAPSYDWAHPPDETK